MHDSIRCIVPNYELIYVLQATLTSKTYIENKEKD